MLCDLLFPVKRMRYHIKQMHPFAGTGEYIYNVTLSGFSSEIKDPESWSRPFVQARKYYHAPLEYRGRQIASSTTEITQLEDGKRTYVSVNIKDGAQNRYLVIREYLPVGTMLVDNSITGNFQHHQIDDGMITFYYRVGEYIRDYQYQLVSYSPGAYRVLPTVISDAMRPGDMRISDSASLEVLAPGEKSKDQYKMNDSEFYELGKAYFDDGKCSKRSNYH